VIVVLVLFVLFVLFVALLAALLAALFANLVRRFWLTSAVHPEEVRRVGCRKD